jgi:hypothetical protein
VAEMYTWLVIFWEATNCPIEAVICYEYFDPSVIYMWLPDEVHRDWVKL